MLTRTRGALAGVLALAMLAGCGLPGSTAARPAQGGTQATPGSQPEDLPLEAAGPTPLPAGELGGPTTGQFTAVPILMYHYIRVNPNPADRVGANLSVTPKEFHLQMLYLAGHGFHVVSLHVAVEAITQHRALPLRPVVLTFDDGYADFYTAAAPELRVRGFTATDYVITGFLGHPNYMTWAQVVELDQQGFTMADHTVDHRGLAVISPAFARWEMAHARQDLEAHLGHSVLDLAYPYGNFDLSVMEQARQLGFESASSTLPGVYHSSAELFKLSRQRVSGGISLSYFAQLVGGPAPTAAWLGWASTQPLATLPDDGPTRVGHYL